MFESHLSHFQCHYDPNVTELIALQAFLQDLGRGQGAVAAFNELSAHLLREYSTDDTRRIKEVTDKHNAAWNSINNRCAQTGLSSCLYAHMWLMFQAVFNNVLTATVVICL